MPTPFPGMDPYLERPGIWNQVHADLIVDIRRFLTPLLQPRYYIAIEQLTYLAVLPPAVDRTGRPDVMVVSPSRGRPVVGSPAVATGGNGPLVAELPLPEEITVRHLEIREVKTHTVITAIEILSPVNKVSRQGRQKYERKRLQVLGSLTHLVEIDLLRAGEPLEMTVAAENDYRILVSRSQARPKADLYLFGVREIIPDVPIPLRPGEVEPVLPLNELLHKLYDLSGYGLMIDYTEPPQPPLSEADADWAAQLVA